MKKLLLFIVFLFFISTCNAIETDRYVSQPIHVYIPQQGRLTQLMQQAFSAWQKQSKSLVRFTYVSKPTDNGINVEFVDFVQRCKDDHAVGCCSNVSGPGRRIVKSYVEIGTKDIVKKASGSTFVMRSEEHLYGVMLHEIGHALGLGHSTNPNSVMYSFDLEALQHLTDEDMRLLYKKYH